MNTKESLVKRLAREWPLAFVFGCILLMLYPMLDADFAMIDDHEIVNALGRNNRVGISETFSLIQDRAFEPKARFRPAHYALFYLEVFFVGGNASMWHTDRLLLALISALALYLAIRVLLPPFLAGVVTLLFFSGPQNEIWIGLGSSEFYGVPLLLIGLAWIAVNLGRHNWQPAQLFPGFALLLLAGFIKESFIPVLPGALALIYVVLPRIIPSIIQDHPRLKLLDMLILFVLIIGVGGQVLMVMKVLYTIGHIYSAEISKTSFLYAIKPMLMEYSKATLWFLPVVAGLVSLIPRNRQEWREQAWRVDLIKAVVLLTAAGFLILAPQWVINGGNIVFAGRYLTPGNLFIIFAAALGFYLLSRNFVDRSHAELRGIVAGMLIVVALLGIHDSYRGAKAAALSTHKFQAKLAEIVQLKTQHPELPLLFYSTNVFDREPLTSVAIFLAAKLPEPEKPFLNPFSWETEADSLFKIRVAKRIKKQALEGDQYFAKIADFRGSDGRCIAVVFSGFAEDFPCDYSVRVRES
jgi:hypothetical protein